MLEIDIRSEKLYPFSKVSELGVFPADVGYKLVYQYAKEGRENLSGVTVFLEHIRTPSGYATSREACYRFIEALNQ